MDFVDKFLNSITMYKLVLYGLLVISVYGVVLDYTRAFSLVVLVLVCYLTNYLFAKLFSAGVNSESAAISALILFLIMSPAANLPEMAILALSGIVAMASKFLIAPMRKHIFNPAAFGAFFIFIFNLGGATWWVGSFVMLPIVLPIGLLIVRKIRRFDLFVPFLISGFTSIFYFHGVLTEALISWPAIFFGTIMLTEPATTPPTKIKRVIYAVMIGLLFGSQFHVWQIIPTPEFVLLAGNIFSYIVSFKARLVLTLKEKSEIAKEIYEFMFIPDRKIIFEPGQYLEYTLPHKNPDIRGNRRYFTIASSPTEGEIRIGMKMNMPLSSFKNALSQMLPGGKISAGQLSGDFILPSDKNRKLVFIAGGIGVTPFRSMTKYLIDKNEKRDVRFFYAVKNAQEIAYRYLWIEAEAKAGVRTEYVIGKFIDEDLIKDKVKDWTERMFYISGPDAMVRSYKKMLLGMGVSRRQIVTDYFPGFA